MNKSGPATFRLTSHQNPTTVPTPGDQGQEHKRISSLNKSTYLYIPLNI